MFQSVIIYFSLMTTMILFGFLAAKKVSFYPGQNISFCKWEVLLPLVCFALVFGMRYGVGMDHLHYLDNYFTGEVDRYEWGFKWITNFFAKNNFHYTVYFGFLAFLQVFFFFYAFKDERYLFPYLVFILFTGGYYIAWMNVIRQDLAACIFIYSIKYIDQKKFLKYLLWCTIAFLFHKSAVILIALYPLLKNGRDYFRSIPMQLLVLFAALAIYYSDFIVENVISSQIEIFASWLRYGYTMDRIDNMVTSANTGIGFLLLAIIYIIIILYSNKMKNYFNSKRFVIIYTLFFLGTIVHIIFAESIILSRPLRYFIYFELIVASYFIYYLFKNAKLSINQIILFLVVAIYLLLFGALLYRGETNTAKFLFFWQI
jgi:hypothetical protein